MLLSTVVAASAELSATRSRLAKTEVVARVLRQAYDEAAAEPEERGLVAVEVAASFLAGAPRQRRLGVGFKGLATLPSPAEEPTVHLVEVDAALEALSTVSGAGSRDHRATLVADLFGRATDAEQRFLRALVFENLRQGAQDSILLDGIAKAAAVPPAAVRRAAMFTPHSGEVAVAALSGGVEALAAFGLVPGRPVRPMLASSAPDVAGAFSKLDGACLVDRKLDGIRVQVHRVDDEVRVFTRSLDDVTDRLPEVVEAVRSLEARSIVLDGEVIALDPQGRPRPFQETASRTGSSAAVEVHRERTPLTVWFFDLLHRDGRDLLDEPGAVRSAALADAVPEHHLVPRIVTSDPEEAQRFFDQTVADGHEGVVVKSPVAPYDAGRRGAGWVKVKPRHTLDLVVLAVEWGSGRRKGWLSNIHLGARSGDGFVMLGKTFKGMTDETLAWQTERFTALAEGPTDGSVVTVRPEQVVEIAFDGVQRSSRYPGGVALRFARVLRYRDDKTADQADTIDSVQALLSPTAASSSAAPRRSTR